jgi:hypothetical protein
VVHDCVRDHIRTLGPVRMRYRKDFWFIVGFCLEPSVRLFLSERSMSRPNVCLFSGRTFKGWAVSVIPRIV